jgi:15-cis-phytoene desaturase
MDTYFQDCISAFCESVSQKKQERSDCDGMIDRDGDNIQHYNTTTMLMKSPWNVLLPWLFLWHSATRIVAFAPSTTTNVPFISTNTARQHWNEKRSSSSMQGTATARSTARSTTRSAHSIQAPDFTNEPSHKQARKNVQALKDLPRPSKPARVIVVGGGLAGLSTAKHLVDAGHQPIVLEARDLLGGKVAAWRDADGDVSETGLHCFFGAYPNAMTIFQDLEITDRLQWKAHQMLFAKTPDAGKPSREFAVFDFPPNLPAPLNAGVAILSCADMLTFSEKIQLGIGLIPAYLQGQSYVEAQEKVTVQQWMDERGIPQSVTDEVFLAMSKALGFIGPESLSMQCVLIALNRFLQETSGSRMAFLDGSPTERLCEPLKEYIEARGGIVRTDAPVKRILLNPDQTVAGLLLKGDEVVSADAYINAMPVDALKKLIPSEWRDMEYFSKLKKLRGVPVMNLHLWFDRKLSTVDNLIFSRSPLLSVYADMSETCNGYADSKQSMLELVLAPAAKYMKKTDEEILQATLQELERLFPAEIRADGSMAQVVKFTCVRTPTSVYETLPGMEEARPTNLSPISNFFMAGDFSLQKYLASMEGAILSGQLAATCFSKVHLENNSKTGDFVAPRQLTERPRNPSAADADERTPAMKMYTVKVASTIPPEVEEELAAGATVLV